MDLWQAISERIARAQGISPFRAASRRAIGGGCINSAHRLEGGGRRWLVKLNRAQALPMFEAEAEGLAELARAGALRVPRPVCHGRHGDAAFLVLEWLELRRGGAEAAARLGRGLAALHRCRGDRYGWHRDNTIGSTPQINTPHHDWVEFYRRHRLRFQLELAARHGHRDLQARGERLAERLDALLEGHAPPPSLLHGDLWSGNQAADAGGAPVVFDPAVYYGDREADLAMTELFGPLPEPFYAAYREAWPLEPGYPRRRTLYNLYHVLNHLNLFGGGYAGQARHMIDALLAECAG